jgi:hypothetical protein
MSLASIVLQSYTNGKGLAGALAICRTPAIQQASCGQGKQCLSGSWGPCQKKSCTVAVTGSVPGSDLAWQSRLRVHVGCACGVKHTRGWTEQTMPTCASSQASRRVSTRTVPRYSPYMCTLTSCLLRPCPGELLLSYCITGNMLLGSNRAAAALLHSAPLAKLVRLFALGLAGPNRSRVPTQRPGSLIARCDWAPAAVPSDPPILVASEICSGSCEEEPSGCVRDIRC